jgi:hypothetical protein
MNTKNTPLTNPKNIPLVLRVQNNIPRSYTNSVLIADIAIDEYKLHNGKGLTYVSLLGRGLARSKRKAQNMLKYNLRNGTLFTISDKRPQVYYPSRLRSEILKDQFQKNIPMDPIGVGLLNTTPSSFTPLGTIKSKHPLSQCIEYMSYYTLEGFVLPLLREAPLLVHNLTFKAKIIPQCYSELNLPFYRRNGGKQYEEIIGNTKVNYILYSSGTVVIHTTCSNHPFKIETEEDRLKLVSFFGQVRAGLIYLLKDKHERIVPDISEWEVTGCDFNKDIKISDYFHMTALKIRIKHLDHLLGIYVKAIKQNTVLRVEETKHPNITAADFVTDIFNPMEKFRLEQLVLRQKIDEIYDIVAKSLSGLSSPEDKNEVLNN